MEKTYIYLVENCYGYPNKVYIGKTKNIIGNNRREKVHKREYGSQIIFTLIDEINSLDKKEWLPLEQYWIEQFRQWGFDLQNGNKGGGGPSYWTKETKIKKSKHPYYKTKKFRNRISKIHKGLKKPMSDEHKLKISIAKKGVLKDKKTRLNISKGVKNRDKQWIEKMKLSRKINANIIFN